MSSLSSIPKILYKYRNWNDENHRRILTDNELFLSSADLFNDPFDSSLPFQFDKKELTEENILRKLIELERKNNPKFDYQKCLGIAKEKILQNDFTSDEYWKNKNEEFQKRSTDRYGICCFSSKNDDLLMWSHYADSHKGLCVGFDSYQLFEATNGAIRKVQYSKYFPKVAMFHRGFEWLDPLINTKSKHWKYEDEYRISKLYAAREIVNFNDSAIKEVVLGCKIDKNVREEIISIVKAKSPIINLYDCIINDKEFKLDIVPKA